MIDTVVLCERWLKLLTNLKKKKKKEMQVTLHLFV